MSRRYDTVALRVTKTGSGGLKAEGNITRTGVFLYHNPDGTERREYRPDGEVFADATLESLSDAPVTVGHPAGLVDPSNWAALSKGHTGAARKDADFIVAPIVVNDAATIDRIQKGELRELSCGYEVDYDPTPGTTPAGERYDGVQRNIRGNHLALLPVGKARGGRDCLIRLDGDEAPPGEAAAKIHPAV